MWSRAACRHSDSTRRMTLTTCGRTSTKAWRPSSAASMSANHNSPWIGTVTSRPAGPISFRGPHGQRHLTSEDESPPLRRATSAPPASRNIDGWPLRQTALAARGNETPLEGKSSLSLEGSEQSLPHHQLTFCPSQTEARTFSPHHFCRLEGGASPIPLLTHFCRHQGASTLSPHQFFCPSRGARHILSSPLLCPRRERAQRCGRKERAPRVALRLASQIRNLFVPEEEERSDAGRQQNDRGCNFAVTTRRRKRTEVELGSSKFFFLWGFANRLRLVGPALAVASRRCSPTPQPAANTQSLIPSPHRKAPIKIGYLADANGTSAPIEPRACILGTDCRATGQHRWGNPGHPLR